MLPIIVVSSRQNSLEELLFRSLSRCGAVFRFGSGLISSPKEPRFFLACASGGEKIELERGVAVVYEPPGMKKLCLSAGVVPIFLSGDRRAVRALRGCENPAVCCGSSPKDSVSVSSRADGRLLVSLQRELQSLEGGLVEPAEFAINARDGELHELLLTAAVLIVAGGEGDIELMQS